MTFKAFIIGGTGEVGKHVVTKLAESEAFAQIVVLSRRQQDLDIPNKEKLVWEIVPDFDKLEDHKVAIEGCSAGFCTLGTTKAKAGSAEKFEHIDYGYTMSIGKMAKESGCKWFGVVTAVGANADSSFLYPRVKGMIERDLIAMEFDCLEIYRPGFLLCERGERRPLEAFGMACAKAINWIAPNRIAVPTEVVAQAMVKQAAAWLQKESPTKGTVSIYGNYEISHLAQ